MHDVQHHYNDEKRIRSGVTSSKHKREMQCYFILYNDIIDNFELLQRKSLYKYLLLLLNIISCNIVLNSACRK